MIDKVIIYKIVSIDASCLRGFSHGDYKTNAGETSEYYSSNINNVKIAYFPETCIFRIAGRLINLSIQPNRVDNLDVLWAGIEHDDRHQSLDDMINDFNRRLYDMTGTFLDVRTFNVSYIECCFNIRTEHVEQYIEVFNRYFQRNQQMGGNKCHSSFVIEAKLPFNESFHVMTNSDRNRKGRIRNYTVNFYNKLNQLRKIQQNNNKKKYSATVTDEDIHKAANILRLEVQCSTQYIRKICQKRRVNRTLQSFLDIDMCAYVIEDKYKQFISKNIFLDFYPYTDAYKKINAYDLPQKQRIMLCKHVLDTIRGRSLLKCRRTHDKYNSILENMGIHSYIMPSSLGSEVLTSPIKILRIKILKLKMARYKFINKYGHTVPWTIITNNNSEDSSEDDLEDFINDVLFVDDLCS